MMRAHVLYHLARADFLERVRRYSFLLTLAFAAGLAFLTYSGVISLQLDQYRGIYNSAWVGSMLTLVSTAFITLAGFYMVKNSIQRDRETRVGLVLATTPIGKSLYTMGKALSNFAVLSAMVAVLAVAAVVLQLLRAEGRLEPGKLLAPFVWVALPAMAMTAALAVLFETLPILRGGAGNVIYFFAWAAYIGASGAAGINDYLGFGIFMRAMVGALKRFDPTYNGSFTLQAGPFAHASKTFLWTGVAWTPQVVLARLQWVAIAIGIAWFSALFFHRFDPAREAGARRAARNARHRHRSGRCASRSDPPDRRDPLNSPVANHAPQSVAAPGRLRVAPDGERAPLVVVSDCGGPVGHQRGGAGCASAPGVRRIRLALARADLVADGRARSSLRYRKAGLLLPSHAWPATARRLASRRRCGDLDRCRMGNSYARRRRLARLHRLAGRRALCAGVRPRPGRLERIEPPF